MPVSQPDSRDQRLSDEFSHHMDGPDSLPHEPWVINGPEAKAVEATAAAAPAVADASSDADAGDAGDAGDAAGPDVPFVVSIVGGPFHTSVFRAVIKRAAEGEGAEELVLMGSKDSAAAAVGGGARGVRNAVCGKVQWFRVPPGDFHSVDPQAIEGATSLIYQADVDDATRCLMVEFTPDKGEYDAATRGNGATLQSDAQPIRAISKQVEIDPDIKQDVDLIVKNGSTKLETTDIGRSGKKERRVIDITKRRLKIIRLTALAAIYSVEVKATYGPPFQVHVFPTDPNRIRIVATIDTEIDLALPSQRARDVLALSIRTFVARQRTGLI
eukprot:TRINITY_DN9660_c0_g1_i1.p1 TRINITY_DN9660_c0_g1~~TRINITY_DN9660_c0_g1_i1.p1  ORF type:complete len:368 (+),score=33.87 TRINITY_DN9660_c0_g1_i1:123-1106(+)